jgi:hypothetical protein
MAVTGNSIPRARGRSLSTKATLHLPEFRANRRNDSYRGRYGTAWLQSPGKATGHGPVEGVYFDELMCDLCTNLGLIALLITHDLDTLYAVCDGVAVLAEQRIAAVGTIDQLKHNPHPWIAQYP